MPRDFRTYAKERDNSNATNSNVNAQNTQSNNYQDVIDKYKSMNQSELMSNLVKEATRLKKEGQLTEDSLTNLKSTLTPFLNIEQINMLEELIKTIK